MIIKNYRHKLKESFMKNKKRIIMIIAIVIILFTIIIAFFVKGNIFAKVENKNVSEINNKNLRRNFSPSLCNLLPLVG